MYFFSFEISTFLNSSFFSGFSTRYLLMLLSRFLEFESLYLNIFRMASLYSVSKSLSLMIFSFVYIGMFLV